MTEQERIWVEAPDHILAIVNPASGSKRGMIVMKRLQEIKKPHITLHITTPDFDYGGAIAAGVADGIDRILLAGGDGTLMEGVSGARRVLGNCVLPFWGVVGTGNVVSGFLGLPHRVRAGAEAGPWAGCHPPDRSGTGGRSLLGAARFDWV